MLQTIPFCKDLHLVILSLCKSEKNIILSLIGSGGTVFHDSPIFQAFFLSLFFTFVKIKLNLLSEEYFLLVSLWVCHLTCYFSIHII